MRTLIALLFIMIGSAFTNAQTNENDYPKTLPSFEFIKIKGEGIFDSKDLKKNKQTLIGIVSPECIHCVVSIEHLSNNYNRLEKVNLILVTEYEKEVFLAKIKEIAPNFLEHEAVQILQDTDGEFVEKFKPVSIPTFYLFNKKGELETVKRGSIEINQIFQYIL